MEQEISHPLNVRTQDLNGKPHFVPVDIQHIKCSNYTEEILDGGDQTKEEELLDMKCIPERVLHKFVAWRQTGRPPWNRNDFIIGDDSKYEPARDANVDPMLNMPPEAELDIRIKELGNMCLLTAKWKIPTMFNHCLSCLDTAAENDRLNNNRKYLDYFHQLGIRCWEHVRTVGPLHGYLTMLMAQVAFGGPFPEWFQRHVEELLKDEDLKWQDQKAECYQWEVHRIIRYHGMQPIPVEEYLMDLE